MALRRHQQHQSVEREHATVWDARGFIFATRNGGPLDSRNVTTDLQAILVRAGLPRQRFQDLRHGFATPQLSSGAELYEVRALGHASIGTTANVYGHFTDGMRERVADRMAGILGGSSA